MTYSWDFGDGGTSTAANPTHVYAAQGAFTARLAVSDGSNTAYAGPIQIRVGGPPVPTITSPANGSTFQAGQLINFTGGATDAEDGALSGSSLTWTVVFDHETHQHPGPGPFAGSSGSFTMPISGHDFTGNTNYQIILTATDSSGLSTSTSVFIYPRKVNVTFNSAPQGLTVLVDSLPHTTPYTFDSLIGFHHTIDTASPQQLAGSGYAFTSWSDGGSQTHDIVVPSVDQAYTMTFAKSGAPNGLVAAYSFNEGSGSTVTDSSGKGNTGTVATPRGPTAGKNRRRAVVQRRQHSRHRFGVLLLDLTTGMTLEAWVKSSALPAAGAP